MPCNRAQLHRLRKTHRGQCFVTGHDFSRAEQPPIWMPWGFSPCIGGLRNRPCPPQPCSQQAAHPRACKPTCARFLLIMVEENVFIQVISPCQLTNISASPVPTISISVRKCPMPLSPPAPGAAAPLSASSAAAREPSPKAAAPHPPQTPAPVAASAAAAAAAPAPWSSVVRFPDQPPAIAPCNRARLQPCRKRRKNGCGL